MKLIIVDDASCVIGWRDLVLGSVSSGLSVGLARRMRRRWRWSRSTWPNVRVGIPCGVSAARGSQLPRRLPQRATAAVSAPTAVFLPGAMVDLDATKEDLDGELGGVHDR
jgi:hypothetical protein